VINRRLKCANCGVTFWATKPQARYHALKKGNAYCSPVCRQAGQSRTAKERAIREGKKIHKGVLAGPCPVCGEMFESHNDKIYCSLACYHKSPQFKKLLPNMKATLEKYREANNAVRSEKAKINCMACGRTFQRRYSKRKFCSRVCHRKFRADLFDAWIANPQDITMPQCYDEYMLQDELPCLIDGCDWKGRNLSNHLNMAHGVYAEDFKRAAGFNLSTGLITADLFEQLSSRQLTGIALGDQRSPPNNDGTVTDYRSREGREHREKARMIAEATRPKPARTCAGCGQQFEQRSVFGRAKNCTTACKNRTYRQKSKPLSGIIKDTP